ncbi:MAG TPA: SGNH/GDSL hydrolase family protein [Micrococcaceae bacterium]|nr:SGNH/GDSL hydrolase family protein [Micrococcaceae bacterium]
MKKPTHSRRGFAARFGAVAAVSMGLLAGAFVAPASAAGSVNYVALGDSYSAGTGAGGESPPCGQSPNSYPNLVGASPGVDLTANLSCFGATTDSVRLLQVRKIPARAQVVTLTVGGNDIGTGAVAVACTIGPQSPACQAATADALFVKLPQLPMKLTAMFRAIKAKAPHARIVVLGYPRLFEPANMAAAGASTAQISAARTMNTAADLLNATIAGTSFLNAARFVSVTGAFAGHGIPSADPWINFNIAGLSDPGNFHPTAEGQARGYAASLLAAVPAL